MPSDSNLKHKPFASLRNAIASPSAVAPKNASAPIEKPFSGRIVVREEYDEVEKAIMTRVIGLPQDRVNSFGKQWRDLLGKTVAIEGRDVLVMTDQHEKIVEWLRNAGATEVALVRRPIPKDLTNLGQAGGTERAQIRRGLHVAIVLKADQDTGTLTEGIVQDILTSSANHHRGIKVRLESGQVGRVRRILGR